MLDHSTTDTDTVGLLGQRLEELHDDPPPLAADRVADGWAWQRFVYCGERVTVSGKRCVKSGQWVPTSMIDEVITQGSRSLPGVLNMPQKRGSAKVVTVPVIGGVYWLCVVTDPDDGSRMVATSESDHAAQRVDHLNVHGSCAIDATVRWQVQHRAAQQLMRRQKTEAAMAKRDLVEEQLAPIRRLMRECRNDRMRALIMADVINYLTTGSTASGYDF